MNETHIVRRIREWLKDQPDVWFVKTFGGPGLVGTPDILACVRGRFVAMEVKKPGAYPTPIQKRHIETITKVGGHAAIVRSLEEAQQVIQAARG